MARGVDDVDLGTLIHNGSVLGQNGDTTLTLDIVGVHDTFCNFLIGAEYAALFQKFIYQSRFAVVNMGNDGNVSDIFSFLSHKNPCLSKNACN